MPRPILLTSALTSLLLTGAIFGFFYAWVCSTMWGLDSTDPRVAIQAMQAMNASVRNGVFFPAFFLTPVALAATAVLARLAGYRSGALFFALAGGVYLFGGLILTMAVNVPMNEALARATVPETQELAAQLWQEYSEPWQTYNIVRTVLSGIALALAGFGMLALGPLARTANGTGATEYGQRFGKAN